MQKIGGSHTASKLTRKDALVEIGVQEDITEARGHGGKRFTPEF